MASPDPTRIFSAYVTSTTTLRRQVQAVVTHSWNGLADYRDADVERFARRVAPVVVGGQRQTASLTAGYLNAMSRAATGERSTIGIPPKLVDAIRGVAALDVYRRMGPTVWTALARGSSLTDAVAIGLDRALITAGTDLQLAKTWAARHVLERSDKVVGFQRVPDGAACELCLLASTQRYHAGDLLPIHNRCGCDVEPLFGTHDPGQIINPDLLDRVNAARESGVDVVVHEHGELGPVLAVRGQSFDGPDDI